MQSVTKFDHALILVEDLDDADARMRRLGFRPTPRGVHSAHMGTANSTIVMPDNTYFEVIGVLHPTESNRDMQRMLEQRQGLLGYAMKTEDARSCVEELKAISANADETVEFSRPVEIAGETRDACFSIANFDLRKTLNIRMFACTHHTPDVVWHKDYLDHPNGAIGIEAVFGEVPDLDQAERMLTTLFRERVSRQNGTITVDYGNVSVGLLSGAELKRRFGLEPLGIAALRVLRLHTADSVLTAEVLEENRVSIVDREEGMLVVAQHETCGVMIQLVSR